MSDMEEKDESTLSQPFNVAPRPKTAETYILQALHSRVSGDGAFSKQCAAWIMEHHNGIAKAMLTTSCSHALEMAAVLCNISAGDEVIMPSFTFTSTANAFVARGATVVFVDVRPDTMNLDETQIERAITDKTKVIVPVHYAGVSCEMDTINAIAAAHNLLVVEDAAQGLMATYKGKSLGALSDFGCFSFHETKNYSMGEGGALLIRDAALCDRAEILWEKGTNRSQFFRGQVDKYTWVDWGSSYLPSELNAAYLWSQLEIAEEINADRLRSWHRYEKHLQPLAARGVLTLPVIPAECEHNGHIFYLKVKDVVERTALLQHLAQHEVHAVYHYVPLHSAPAGKQFGRFSGDDRYTTAESERLLRLPMYYGLSDDLIDRTCEAIHDFLRR